jgi:N-dimethylarginine dimethylaminohydrolase
LTYKYSLFFTKKICFLSFVLAVEKDKFKISQQDWPNFFDIIPPMRFNIVDEFSPLKKAVVCWGYSISDCKTHKNNDPQEDKWGWTKWDKQLLLKQQDLFFLALQKYNVELVEIKARSGLTHQMYTRDTAFVIDDTLYYSDKRTLKTRKGEIKELLAIIASNNEKIVALPGKIEGGDVLVSSVSLVGLSNRTDQKGAQALLKNNNTKTLFVGDNVMHLDTRLALLPNNYALAHTEAFTKEDREYLSQKYKIIPVSKEESRHLGSNVFVVNPDTVFVEKSQRNIKDQIKEAGFKVETLSYTEPIALGGSFRCTILPLIRE